MPSASKSRVADNIMATDLGLATHLLGSVPNGISYISGLVGAEAAAQAVTPGCCAWFLRLWALSHSVAGSWRTCFGPWSRRSTPRRSQRVPPSLSHSTETCCHVRWMYTLRGWRLCHCQLKPLSWTRCAHGTLYMAICDNGEVI